MKTFLNFYRGEKDNTTRQINTRTISLTISPTTIQTTIQTKHPTSKHIKTGIGIQFHLHFEIKMYTFVLR